MPHVHAATLPRLVGLALGTCFNNPRGFSACTSAGHPRLCLFRPQRLVALDISPVGPARMESYTKCDTTKRKANRGNTATSPPQESNGNDTACDTVLGLLPHREVLFCSALRIGLSPAHRHSPARFFDSRGWVDITFVVSEARRCETCSRINLPTPEMTQERRIRRQSHGRVVTVSFP